MGVAHFVVLERDIDGLDTFMNGKAFAHAEFEDECEKALTQIAREISVTPLTDFMSFDLNTILGYMELTRETATPGDLATVGQEEWFDPAVGPASANALISYLTAHPDALPNAEWVIGDLKEVIRILTAAQQHGVRWRLQVDA